MVEKFACAVCMTTFMQNTMSKPYVQCPACSTYRVIPIALAEVYAKLMGNPDFKKRYDQFFKNGDTKEQKKSKKKGPIGFHKEGK